MQEVDADLTALDRDHQTFQGGFPVTERPFEPAAARLRERGIDDRTGPELCERVRELDEAGTLSGSGRSSTPRIGGAASLVAMHAPEDRPVRGDRGDGQRVHRGGAQLRARASPPQHVVRRERRRPPGSRQGRERPGRRGTRGDRGRDRAGDVQPPEGSRVPRRREVPRRRPGSRRRDRSTSRIWGPRFRPAAGRRSPDERDLVVEIQGGLPITEMPYADVAAAIGAEVDWVIETIKRFNAEGKVRRVGVIPNHYALGYTENGMTVWDVPRTRSTRSGRSSRGSTSSPTVTSDPARGRLGVQLLRDDPRADGGRKRAPDRGGQRADGRVLGSRRERLGHAVLDPNLEEDGDRIADRADSNTA